MYISCKCCLGEKKSERLWAKRERESEERIGLGQDGCLVDGGGAMGVGISFGHNLLEISEYPGCKANR